MLEEFKYILMTFFISVSLTAIILIAILVILVKYEEMASRICGC